MLNFGGVSFEVFADRLKCILIVDFSFIAQAVCFAAEVLTVFFFFHVFEKIRKMELQEHSTRISSKTHTVLVYIYCLYHALNLPPPGMQSFSKYRFLGGWDFHLILKHAAAMSICLGGGLTCTNLRHAGGLVNLATLPQ